jgi:hypothetical protein
MWLKRMIGTVAERHALACKNTKGIFEKNGDLLVRRGLQSLKVSKMLIDPPALFGTE